MAPGWQFPPPSHSIRWPTPNASRGSKTNTRQFALPQAPARCGRGLEGRPALPVVEEHGGHARRVERDGCGLRLGHKGRLDDAARPPTHAPPVGLRGVRARGYCREDEGRRASSRSTHRTASCPPRRWTKSIVGVALTMRTEISRPRSEWGNGLRRHARQAGRFRRSPRLLGCGHRPARTSPMRSFTAAVILSDGSRASAASAVALARSSCSSIK